MRTLALCSLLLVGLTTVARAADGPVAPPVPVTFQLFPAETQLLVDGVSVEWRAGAVELVPGRHRVDAQLSRNQISCVRQVMRSPLGRGGRWLRRRVRMCYWKQWRRARTRIRQLLALGTDPKHAILTGLSRKGYWHLARTLATQTGMTNQWLAEQGLLSISTLWMTAHGYTD